MFLRLLRAGRVTLTSQSNFRSFGKKAKGGKDSKDKPDTPEFNFDLSKVEKEMEASVKLFENSLQKITIGRGDLKIFDKVFVQSKHAELSTLAQITAKNANEFTIKPFDVADLEVILSALNSSDLRVQYRKEGTTAISVTIPKPTQEYKNELIKQAKEFFEETKQNIRKKRQNSLNGLKDVKEIGEDDLKRIKNDIQQVTDKYTETIEKMLKAKEKVINS